jgi:hypothetical protein
MNSNRFRKAAATRASIAMIQRTTASVSGLVERFRAEERILTNQIEEATARRRTIRAEIRRIEAAERERISNARAVLVLPKAAAKTAKTARGREIDLSDE